MYVYVHSICNYVCTCTMYIYGMYTYIYIHSLLFINLLSPYGY